MTSVNITIEPFSVDDPNANYGVQLTGELEKIVIDSSKAFFMIERFNTGVPASLPLNNGDTFHFQLGFSTDIDLSSMYGAYLLNLTVIFLSQASISPDDGENRGTMTPPVQKPGSEQPAFALHNNTLIMVPPCLESWNFKKHAFESASMTIEVPESERRLGQKTVHYQMQIMGTAAIQTVQNGPTYFLPFAHDPIMVINLEQ